MVLVPGMIPDIQGYLEEKKNDYRQRRRLRLNRPLETYEYPPDHWSQDECMLVRLPLELVFMIIEDFYQADLLHLALTCRRMAECTLETMYKRDITRFGCMALRWGCTFGLIPTLERTMLYGAPADYIFPADSAVGCKWVIGGRDYYYSETSALVTAIVSDEPEAVRLLIARGAPINGYPDTYLDNGVLLRFQPISFAMGHPHWPVLRRGVSPGNPEIVRMLLDAGADPNFEEKANLEERGINVLTWTCATPLYLAMQSKVPSETVKLLLERGADPSISVTTPMTSQLVWRLRVPITSSRDFWRCSPLEMLLIPEHPRLKKVLGMDWKRVRGMNWVSGMNWEKVKLLVAYGAASGGELENSSRSVYPLLYRYLDCQHAIGLARVILAQGADMAEWTARCKISPIQAVIWWAEARSRVLVAGDMERIPHVLDRMCELVTLLAEASLPRSHVVNWPMWITEGLDPLLSDKFSPRRVASSHPEPLSYVCSPFRFFGATRLIYILLQFGADINGKCSAGVTALHHAVMFNTTGEPVRLLLDFNGGPSHSGLDVNARDWWSWTPLHYACHFGFRRRQADQADAVRMLLDHGADIHARSDSGITPLLLAVWCCNVPVARLLLDRGASRKDLEIHP
ncbi:ff7e848e-065a-48d5-bce0-8fa9aa0ca199, partial [Naviculisporaceae sp. PSN 640]